jgi:peptide deformylase
MSVLSLCTEPHPVLRSIALPVEAFTKEVRRLARDLVETMYVNDGIGLATPQVGRSLQLFVLNPSQKPGEEVVLVNPVITQTAGKASVTEGCLSLPGVWHKVGRAAKVRISGRDLYGKAVTLEAEGLPAIVLQHEMDHLRGKLFIDRLSWLRRQRALRAYRTSQQK